MSCNNRINSGEEFNSVGTTVPTTPRAVRATQHLTELLRSGKKVSVSDMQKLQLDVIDVYGERLAPLMLKVVDKYEAELLEKDPARREIVKRMTQGLRGWNGETAMDSKSALIFSVWREQLGALMLKAYFTNEYERNSVMTSFFIDHFVGKQVKAWSEGKNIMSNFCAESFSSVKSLSCAHVVVQALLNAHALLVGELGSNEAQWKWGRHHILQYKHMPLSQTPLKIFFQREVPSPVFNGMR